MESPRLDAAPRRDTTGADSGESSRFTRRGWRLFGDRPKEAWVAQYAASHRHPVNRACHLLGIPLITAALLAATLIPIWPSWWGVPAGMFAAGWLLQIVGHLFEGKPPEFLRDWRFLLIGFSWWLTKIRKSPYGSRR